MQLHRAHRGPTSLHAQGAARRLVLILLVSNARFSVASTNDGGIEYLKALSQATEPSELDSGSASVRSWDELSVGDVAVDGFARRKMARLHSEVDENFAPQFAEFITNMKKLDLARRKACEGFLDEDGQVKLDAERAVHEAKGGKFSAFASPHALGSVSFFLSYNLKEFWESWWPGYCITLCVVSFVILVSLFFFWLTCSICRWPSDSPRACAPKLQDSSRRRILLCGLLLALGALIVAIFAQQSTHAFLEDLQEGHCLLLDGLDAVLRGRRLPPAGEGLVEGEDFRQTEGLLHILRVSRLAERALDPLSPSYAPAAAAREVLPQLLLNAETDAVAGKVQLLRKLSGRIQRIAALRSQKCAFCATKEAADNFSGIASHPVPPRTLLSNKVQVAMQEAAGKMPAFSANAIIHCLISSFNMSAGVPIEAAAQTSQSLRSMQLYNTVETTLLCLIMGAVFIFLVICYIKERKHSSTPQEHCSLCTLLHVAAAGVLLAASFFLALRAFVDDRCEGRETEFFNRTSLAPAETLPSLLGSCMATGRSGSLFDATGLRESVLKPREEAMRAAGGDLSIVLPQLPTESAQIAEALAAEAKVFGGVFLPDTQGFKDPSIDPNSRLKVPKEFLSSGIQIEDEVVDLPGTGPTLIYGLRSLQQIAAPWVVQPLANDAEEPYVITETTPSPYDQTLIVWLRDRSRKGADELIQAGAAKEEIRKAEVDAEIEGRNIIWWLQQKLRLRWQLKLLIHAQLGDDAQAGSSSGEENVNPFMSVTQQAAHAVSDFHAAWLSAPANARVVARQELMRPAVLLDSLLSLSCRNLGSLVAAVSDQLCTKPKRASAGDVLRVVEGFLIYALAVIFLAQRTAPLDAR
ncbi:hypothetical protein Efla_001894 [Eimeria flavescens]